MRALKIVGQECPITPTWQAELVGSKGNGLVGAKALILFQGHFGKELPSLVAASIFGKASKQPMEDYDFLFGLLRFVFGWLRRLA